MHPRLRPLLYVVLIAAAALVWWWTPVSDVASPPASAPEVRSAPAPKRSAESARASQATERPAAATVSLPDFLPAEAHDTLRLIARGGPFPHRQDGGVFGNRERRLPRQPSGYYREYTVRTPGLPHRGARRIVTGGDPPQEYFYTDDHYASFRRFEVPR